MERGNFIWKGATMKKLILTLLASIMIISCSQTIRIQDKETGLNLIALRSALKVIFCDIKKAICIRNHGHFDIIVVTYDKPTALYFRTKLCVVIEVSKFKYYNFINKVSPDKINWRKKQIPVRPETKKMEDKKNGRRI